MGSPIGILIIQWPDVPSGASLLWISTAMPPYTHAAWGRLLLSHCSQSPHLEREQSHYPISRKDSLGD